MTVSADKGRAKITEAINQLKEVRSESSTSVVLPIFSDSKLDEVINIYSKAPQQEKEDSLCSATACCNIKKHNTENTKTRSHA